MRIVKILWIDDAQAWTRSVQDNLDLISKKYNVKFKFINAENGDDIIFQCNSYDLDIIVMDYDMEPFSGDKYINDVRSEEHLEQIPILFYSQNNSVNLKSLLKNPKHTECLHRPNLEDKIKEIFFKQ
jgi:Response regulator containing a CheY-like receiver domain and a GGDEF domain